MGNYAEIIDGKVAQVLVVDGSEAEAVAWLKANVSTNEWLKTEKDGSKRGKFAGVGDEFHADIDVFIKKPFESWALDKGRKMFLPPIPKPLAILVGYAWQWIEATGQWVEQAIKGK